MRFSSGLASLSLAVALASACVSAKTTNCRKCSPDVHITGVMHADKFDEFWSESFPVFTGGDGFSWQRKPTSEQGWEGSANFPRLCGKAGTIDHTWNFNKFIEGPTRVRLNGTCGENVRCRDNSHCEVSQIS